jgi:hypothetical protein
MQANQGSGTGSCVLQDKLLNLPHAAGCYAIIAGFVHSVKCGLTLGPVVCTCSSCWQGDFNRSHPANQVYKSYASEGLSSMRIVDKNGCCFWIKGAAFSSRG